MATVQVTFKRAMDGAPLESSGFTSNETITSSGTSQATTGAAQNGDIMVIQTDGAIRFTVAETPTAVADDTSELLTAGRYQFAVPVGHKCAVIDA